MSLHYLVKHVAHRARATAEMPEKERPEFIPPQLWAPVSPDLWNTASEDV